MSKGGEDPGLGPKKEAAGPGAVWSRSQQARFCLYVYERGLAIQGTEPGLGCRASGEPLGCVCMCMALCTGCVGWEVQAACVMYEPSIVCFRGVARVLV